MISSRTGWSFRRRMLEAISAYRQAAPKLLGLTLRELADLIGAQLSLCRAQLRLWTRNRGTLVDAGASVAASANVDPKHLARARVLAQAITRAAKYGVFRPSCLVRSIALCRLMEHYSIPGASVQVGVILRDGKFVAHAWVVFAGEVLGDDAVAVARYAPLTDVSVRHGD